MIKGSNNQSNEGNLHQRSDDDAEDVNWWYHCSSSPCLFFESQSPIVPTICNISHFFISHENDVVYAENLCRLRQNTHPLNKCTFIYICLNNTQYNFRLNFMELWENFSKYQGLILNVIFLVLFFSNIKTNPNALKP